MNRYFYANTIENFVKSNPNYRICIVWDGDLRRENNTWGNYSFTGNKWQNIRSEERKSYQINAYRVLLTRARQGMIICVPKGNPEDGTRNPAYYDGTFNYLRSI